MKFTMQLQNELFAKYSVRINGLLLMSFDIGGKRILIVIKSDAPYVAQ